MSWLIAKGVYHNERPFDYGVGSPSPMPFEDNIVANNLLLGYTIKAYALLGLERFNEAEIVIDKERY